MKSIELNDRTAVVGKSSIFIWPFGK